MRPERWRQLDYMMDLGAAGLHDAQTAKEYALILQATRINLGTASWRERWRWRLRLGPAPWMLRAGETSIELRRMAERL